MRWPSTTPIISPFNSKRTNSSQGRVPRGSPPSRLSIPKGPIQARNQSKPPRRLHTFNSKRTNSSRLLIWWRWGRILLSIPKGPIQAGIYNAITKPGQGFQFQKDQFKRTCSTPSEPTCATFNSKRTNSSFYTGSFCPYNSRLSIPKGPIQASPVDGVGAGSGCFQFQKDQFKRVFSCPNVNAGQFFQFQKDQFKRQSELAILREQEAFNSKRTNSSDVVPNLYRPACMLSILKGPIQAHC